VQPAGSAGDAAFLEDRQKDLYALLIHATPSSQNIAFSYIIKSQKPPVNRYAPSLVSSVL
jgi:hypothetical protein